MQACSFPPPTKFFWIKPCKDLEEDCLHQLQQSLQLSNILSLMKCLWWDGKCLVKSTQTDLPSPCTGCIWKMFLPPLWRLWSASSCDGSPTLHHSLTTCKVKIDPIDEIIGQCSKCQMMVKLNSSTGHHNVHSKHPCTGQPR